VSRNCTESAVLVNLIWGATASAAVATGRPLVKVATTSVEVQDETETSADLKSAVAEWSAELGKLVPV
jgi:hypothetical protein